ncbi:hypothetical protein IC235_03375 [Hymenobacter sp. BT664]|uniref:Uncharacterized protein n=1 Tax=Hymenobacter montanus TaxID=2771359 RepID=A0A927GIC6_9BACT|nr:hypothetical protein [Hymenobacter montanus]MBD2766931.1 hypothetical protein [Hymenobacter montanus]
MPQAVDLLSAALLTRAMANDQATTVAEVASIGRAGQAAGQNAPSCRTTRAVDFALE